MGGAVLPQSMHYIGGVDQFGVFYATDREIYAIKRDDFITGTGIPKRALQTPQHLMDYYRGMDMTMEQAERVCLLVKLFGPQEKQ
jgi:hypothetical protein